MVRTFRETVVTTGQGDARDVTAAVNQALSRAGLTAGIVTVFVAGSTAGVTTIEFESGVIADLDRTLESLAPRTAEYRHHLRWGDDNGSSHVRAALVGPSVTVPFAEGKLLLGTWQQIALVELDTRGRRRDVIVQIVGE
jgi:secondary thiamine-phosphate synthase enzyme